MSEMYLSFWVPQGSFWMWDVALGLPLRGVSLKNLGDGYTMSIFEVTRPETWEDGFKLSTTYTGEGATYEVSLTHETETVYIPAFLVDGRVQVTYTTDSKEFFVEVWVDAGENEKALPHILRKVAVGYSAKSLSQYRVSFSGISPEFEKEYAVFMFGGEELKMTFAKRGSQEPGILIHLVEIFKNNLTYVAPVEKIDNPAQETIIRKYVEILYGKGVFVSMWRYYMVRGGFESL